MKIGIGLGLVYLNNMFIIASSFIWGTSTPTKVWGTSTSETWG
jgi:hypothetical protein